MYWLCYHNNFDISTDLIELILNFHRIKLMWEIKILDADFSNFFTEFFMLPQAYVQ